MAQNNPKIAGLCRDIIRQFTIGPVEWHDFSMYREVWSSSIYSTEIPQTRVCENGRTISVVPLLNGFYVYFEMSFSSIKKCKLSELSLQFYDDEYLLFRTDWVHRGMQMSMHAQPHWHINPIWQHSEIIPESMTYDEYLREDYHLYKENANGRKMGICLDIDRLHFFTSYREGGVTDLDFQDDSILKEWLKYTMNYMDVQLRNITTHK